MPAALVNDFAKRSRKPVKEVERLWDKAKGLVKKNYDMDEPAGGDESPKYWKLVVGILKRMLKLEHAADPELDRIVEEVKAAPSANDKLRAIARRRGNKAVAVRVRVNGKTKTIRVRMDRRGAGVLGIDTQGVGKFRVYTADEIDDAGWEVLDD